MGREYENDAERRIAAAEEHLYTLGNEANALRISRVVDTLSDVHQELKAKRMRSQLGLRIYTSYTPEVEEYIKQTQSLHTAAIFASDSEDPLLGVELRYNLFDLISINLGRYFRGSYLREVPREPHTAYESILTLVNQDEVMWIGHQQRSFNEERRLVDSRPDGVHLENEEWQSPATVKEILTSFLTKYPPYK